MLFTDGSTPVGLCAQAWRRTREFVGSFCKKNVIDKIYCTETKHSKLKASFEDASFVICFYANPGFWICVICQCS